VDGLKALPPFTPESSELFAAMDQYLAGAGIPLKDLFDHFDYPPRGCLSVKQCGKMVAYLILERKKMLLRIFGPKDSLATTHFPPIK
jgi:hypothetical protein